MPRILMIDDEPIYHKMVEHALSTLGYEMYYALDGIQGLNAASAIDPDLVISDVLMPQLTGYEVTRRLRENPRFADIPVLILTGKDQLGDKLKAFEAGADDYLTKPFAPAELVARLNVLLSRSQKLKTLQALDKDKKVENARIIAVHSLRGGVGCSSMAVNLAVAFWELWHRPTLLVDAVLTAGQIALMLNMPLKRTWASIADINAAELDMKTLRSIIFSYKNTFDCIAGPTTPSEAEIISPEALRASLNLLKTLYDYIVIDLPHDFNEVSIHMLDIANIILMMGAPEMASIRAVAAAIDAFQKLGYDPEKYRLVLNHTFEQEGLKQGQIEKALDVSVKLSIPYAPLDFIRAINIGRPLVYGSPTSPVTVLIENAAYQFSKEGHKDMIPAEPTETWKLVSQRNLRKATAAE